MGDRFDLESEQILSLLEFEFQLQQIKHIHPHIVIIKRTKWAMKNKSRFTIQPKKQTFSKTTIFLNTDCQY